MNVTPTFTNMTELYIVKENLFTWIWKRAIFPNIDNCRVLFSKFTIWTSRVGRPSAISNVKWSCQYYQVSYCQSVKEHFYKHNTSITFLMTGELSYIIIIPDH